MTKQLLCWWCRSRLRNSNYDNALVWDVRTCCKRCFIERLNEWNDKLNREIAIKPISNATEPFKQLPEASQPNITAQNHICCGSTIRKENYLYICGQLADGMGNRIYCDNCVKLHIHPTLQGVEPSDRIKEVGSG